MATTTATSASPLPGDVAALTISLTAPSLRPLDPAPAAKEAPPVPGIRPYNPETDRAGIEAVFRAVYAPLYAFAGLTTIAWIVFCRAYLDISPESCSVLATSFRAGPPRILGYIVGTPDSAAFCAAFAANRGSCRTDIQDVPAAPRMDEMRDPELRARCMEYFRQRNRWVSAVGSGIAGIEKVVFSDAEALLAENYPAHFHMAIAPEAQRCGFGAKLVGMFSEGLRAMGGVKGVFAATPVDNEGAGKLYRGCGFGGLRSQEGEEVGVLGGGEGEMEGKVFLVRELR